VISEHDHDYQRILAFDHHGDTDEFIHGFEAGYVWSVLEELRDDQEWCQTIHSSNAEIIMRMCDKLHIHFVGKEIDDDWIHVHFTATLPTSLRERLDS
jgi:hypothetical protein